MYVLDLPTYGAECIRERPEGTIFRIWIQPKKLRMSSRVSRGEMGNWKDNGP